MEFFATLAQVVNVISAFGVIILVLLQHGKGADMGAAFGSGSAGGLFGSAGSANFLSRTTAVCASVFFASCLALVLLAAPAKKKTELGVMSDVVHTASQPVAASKPAQNKIPD